MCPRDFLFGAALIGALLFVGVACDDDSEGAPVPSVDVEEPPETVDSPDVDDPCVPDCDGRDCGPDGCGDVCGVCTPELECDEDLGQCFDPVVCEPDCDDRECGSDGCGGDCGACGDDEICVDGQCVGEGGASCGGTPCPALSDYAAACNDHEFCEYTYAGDDEAPWREHDVWILVPPGSFEMGAPESELGSEEEERPVRTVTFAEGFLIAKYPITVMGYEACLEEFGCEIPSVDGWDGHGWGLNTSANDRARHPQNGLRWDTAGQFCSWNGARLPSEAEWEYAAKGPVHRRFPWGDEPEPNCENETAVFSDGGAGADWSGCGEGGTWEVGSMTAGASWCGALDMAGNLWEWVEDIWHAGYEGAPVDGSARVNGGSPQRVMRGGGFVNSANTMRAAKRVFFQAAIEYADRGGRCARDL